MTDPMYRETGGGAVETDDKKGTVVAYLAKADQDSYGTRFEVEGWDFSIFRASGTVSFNHGSTPIGAFVNPDASIYERLPIARPLRVWTDSEGVLLHYQYPLDAPGKYGEFVKTIYFLEKEGLLRGHSMWFEPYEWEDPGGKVGTREWGDPHPRDPVKGRVYKRQALKEGGPVLAPAAPEAVTLAARAFSTKGLPIPAPFQEPEEEKTTRTIELSEDEFIAWEKFRARVVPPRDEEKERKDEAALLREFARVTRRKLDALTTREGG